jgi:CcmD family protein
MDVRNFTYMFYGFLAVWLVLCAYVVSLATREHRIRRELERLKLMVAEKERPTTPTSA